MEIRNVVQLTLPTSTPQANNLSQWIQGQLLRATVVERLSSQTLLFKSGERLFEAASRNATSFKPGDSITLQVEKTSPPVVLKIVDKNQQIKLELQQQLIRKSLPKQNDMSALTALFKQFRSNGSNVSQALPLPVSKQLQQLINNMPKSHALGNSQGIQAAVKESGVFMESRLLEQIIRKTQQPITNSTPFSIEQDFKANLLKLRKTVSEQMQKPLLTHQLQNVTPDKPPASVLARTVIEGSNRRLSPEQAAMAEKSTAINKNNMDIAIKPDSTQLLKQLESSIARLETAQARSISTESSPVPHWRFEFPVTDKNDLDLVKLDLNKENSARSDTESANWAVNIEIDFQDIGRFCARLSCHEDDMNISLWAEHANLADMINKHLARLHEKFSRHGINNAVIRLQNTEPVNKETIRHTNLINISL